MGHLLVLFFCQKPRLLSKIAQIIDKKDRLRYNKTAEWWRITSLFGGLLRKETFLVENKNLVRFLLTFFLGWIGSLIINHSSLKPEGFKSRFNIDCSHVTFILNLYSFNIYLVTKHSCSITLSLAYYGIS